MKFRNPYKEHAKTLYEKAMNIPEVLNTLGDAAAQKKHNDVTAESLYFISTLLIDVRDILLLLLGSALYKLIRSLFSL